MWLRNSEEEMKEGTLETRILMDVVDYPGTRPNPAHYPKSPGKPWLHVWSWKSGFWLVI